MKNVLVNYEVVSGEWSAHSVRTFRLEGEDVTEVIHSFWIFWRKILLLMRKDVFIITKAGNKLSRFLE